MVLTKGQEVWEELYNEREIINDERELEELLIDTRQIFKIII